MTPDTASEPSDVSDAGRPDDIVPPADLQRLAIIASFWAIVLLGLPFWWTTTSITRHALPAAQVAELAKLQPCPLELPVSLEFVDVQWTEERRGAIVDELGVFASKSEIWRCLRFGQARHTTAGKPVTPIGADDLRAEDIAGVLMPTTTSNPTGVDPRIAKYSAEYKLVYSLLWQEPPDTAVTWQEISIPADHIWPILSALAPLNNFSVESQVQSFAPLTIPLAYDDSGQAIIEEDQLKAFINSAEWNLASSASLLPALHFVLYIPKPHTSLRIRQSNGSLSESNAFLTPQWGGVVIYNPDDVEAHLSPRALDRPFALFAQQLLILLGIPSHTSSDFPDKVDTVLHTMYRRIAAVSAREAVDTLAAIIKLATEIRNMRVGESVATGVEAAILHLRLAQKAAHSGDLQSAFHNAVQANEQAEHAFFDPDMLALLYFPAEHVYAVYTPLFGPIAVPLLLSLIREVKTWRKRRRASRLKAE